MKKFISLVSATMFLVSVFAGAVFVSAAAAQENEVPVVEQAQNEGQDQDNDENKEEAKTVTYSYVAQPGDSYSLLARKAIQTYGLKNKVSLSQAKIIAAETHLTQAASSPFLNEGQKIEIKETDVQKAVEEVQKLTATQEAAWAIYTAGVDFNTNNVGQ